MHVCAHRTIKFTSEWSCKAISFLDTPVVVSNGTLSTDLYTKKTDTHQYLAADSCHPWHCKAAIAYSQALRIRHICSFDDDFKRYVDNLRSHLICRVYDPSFIRGQVDRTNSIRREDLLVSSKVSTRVPLVTTFHPNLPKLSVITGIYLPLPHISQRLKQALKKPIIAYRCPKNLWD